MPTRLMHVLVAASLFVTAPSVVLAGTIYDSKIMERIKFSSAQRPQARAVIRESDREMKTVFRKYGIDPNARPVFEKLRAASGELQAIRSRQKRAMKKIMTPEQYKTYLDILEQTAARVVKATRKKP